MAKNSGSSSQIISLPKGGGAQKGIGEKFSPDLHTGTGNFTVPIALPPGRNGFQPQLNLVYSTGNGNGPFGLGRSLSVPGVSRKASHGNPQYKDNSTTPEDWDTFILSGAEDLVPVEQSNGVTVYRPRTEGLFARIEHHRNDRNDYWEVRSKDGLVSLYGTPRPAGAGPNWRDPAVIADPDYPSHIFAWKLSLTTDSFGNRIEYVYERDEVQTEGPHHWDQLYLYEIHYVDYGDLANPGFLVSVRFIYEGRPDPFSEYRTGFEIRTVKRCNKIEISTHPAADLHVHTRTYELVYIDERDFPADQQPLNGVSLLSQIKVVGHDGGKTEELPSLEFAYIRFEPEKRDFFPLTGHDLPPASLANPDYELVDLFGNGLPDILEMNGAARYWRNMGNGTYDLPREMRDAPAGLRFAEKGVQLIDANGDGRTDLLVSTEIMAGYYPLQFGGLWDRRSFQRYQQAPSFNLEDPEVRLIDLDGDGITDAIRSGTRLECFFNDPKAGWNDTSFVERQAIEDFPNINFSDPRVKWADMSGDGMQDILLVYDGNVEYWPNLGYGNWAKRISMRNSPRFPYGYDPRRILVGDVDGDGLADIVYVDDTKVTLWINQSGNRWGDPIEINGTPPVSDMDAVRLADMLGIGTSGILWSSDASGLSREHMFFLDFTGGIKPYLLNEMNNHMGAVTRVNYEPSTRFYLKDEIRPETRWKTPLPFPVQVVSRVEVIDEISKGKLTTEYRYHHGYWDGAEREFRGFGMVEQFDTEMFEEYNTPGLHGGEREFERVEKHFSPPTLTKTWFHQGPVGEEFGEWVEQDWSDGYWQGDPQILKHTDAVNNFLKGLSDRRIKRDALRTLRGSILRTELYALDGTGRQDRPYTIIEHAYGLREESLPVEGEKERLRIFFPHALAQRTTQWERGDDPMSQFSFTNDYDAFGQPQKQTQIACPRGWRHLGDTPNAPFLATCTRTVYAQPVDLEFYINDRVAKATAYEIKNNGSQTVLALKNLPDTDSALSIISQTLNFYDGPAFQGLPFGQVGPHGALVRTENLALTDDILQQAYGTELPPYLSHDGSIVWPAEYPMEFRSALPSQAGYIYQPGGAGSPYTAGYFVAAERRSYDFHDDPMGRGLVKVKRDPVGRDTTMAYDTYNLLPIKVEDPVGLKTSAEYDYRVFQPREVTDPNENRTVFAFTPLGLLESTAVMGKSSENAGDSPVVPGTKLQYDFKAFINQGQPISVRTVKRIHHVNDWDIPEPERSQTIETVEYSDGFGRLLQTRTQAEDVVFGDGTFGGGVLPANQGDGAGNDVVGVRNSDAVKPNVVVSGWQVYDNKGRVVEKYEPFFDTGWDFAPPGEEQFGEKATMYYDPRGQVIRTVNPDGSEQRVIYGIPTDLADPTHFIPTPWETYTYDSNDNAGRTHPSVSAGYQEHWNTPTSAVVDALGRTIETTERNGATPLSDWFKTRSTYDIRGNLLTVTDALSRIAFKHIYDLANRPLRIENFDAGTRSIVLDATGNEIERRDSKGALLLHAYDVLNRPIRLWARDDGSSLVTLREKLEYGDGSDRNQPVSERDANRSFNRLGKLYNHYDEAGLLTFESYDFKGNVLEKVRQVITDSAILAVFNSPPPDWAIKAFRVDWAPTNSAASLLDQTKYQTTMTYDALNRIKTMQYPQDVDRERKKLHPHYNRAGALESVSLDDATYVERIAYNAKGQRTLIAYGNGVMTRYAYDPKTFRLVRMRTEHYTIPSALTYHPIGAPLQDFAYKYDLTGNILSIKDITLGCGVINTPQGADVLERAFSYDPLYRLISATGREDKNIPKPRPWTDDARQGFNSGNHGTPNQDNAPNLTSMYWEEYAYDPAGNMLSMKHRNNGSQWTRRFGMGGLTPQQWNQEWPAHLNAAGEWANPPGNKLTHVGDDNIAIPQTHFFDSNGNLIRENTERHFEWDHSDRMRVFRNQTAGAEPSVHAHYLYDVSGQRVKKLIRKQSGEYEVTVYIDGVFEYHRLVKPGQTIENNTLHVMDNQSRIAMVRVGNPFPGDASPAVKYHLGDHLSSSTIVINEDGVWVNREEYFPYGETSFGSFAKKRYRFTGKERDEESGLYYHGARYYVPWLGRWTSCDPIEMVDGPNLYGFTRNNPVRLRDITGGQSTKGQSLDFPAEMVIGRAITGASSPAPDSSLGEHMDKGAEMTKRDPMLELPSPPLLRVEEADAPFMAQASSEEWINYPSHPAFIEETTGREYVNLWRSKTAFGIEGPPGWAVEHWWIETPSKEAGMGPVGGYGTNPAPGALSSIKTAITSHKDFGRWRPQSGIPTKLREDIDEPRTGFDVTRIYGQPGFTEVVDKQLNIGEPLGGWGIDNNCQTFAIRVLRGAGATNIPEPFTNRIPQEIHKWSVEQKRKYREMGKLSW